VVKWIDTTLFGGEVKETRTGSNPVLTTAQFFLLLLGSADIKKKAKSGYSQVAEVGNAQEGLVCGARLVTGSNPVLVTKQLVLMVVATGRSAKSTE
jgi:hypothetical protein